MEEWVLDPVGKWIESRQGATKRDLEELDGAVN
jgi:hypothetical protein